MTIPYDLSEEQRDELVERVARRDASTGSVRA